jgi:hypothetical protein
MKIKDFNNIEKLIKNKYFISSKIELEKRTTIYLITNGCNETDLKNYKQHILNK